MKKKLSVLILVVAMLVTCFNGIQPVAYAADTNWMADAGYGLFIHWNVNTVNEDGSKVDYKTAVANFDVNAFANQVEATGAKFIIFTIAHSGYNFAMPNATLDSLVPGRTTTRDLYADMYNALNPKGIKMMFYYENTGSDDSAFAEATRWNSSSAADNAIYVQSQYDIVSEIGNRYGSKLAGWWFDVCFYNLEQYYGWYPYDRFNPFSTYWTKTLAGNSNRVVAFNFDGSKNKWGFDGKAGDYQAGEETSLTNYPTGQYSGVAGRQWFACAGMQTCGWIHTKSGVATPSYTDDQVINYIKAVMAYRGVFAYNVAAYQKNAEISAPVMDQLAKVKAALRTNYVRPNVYKVTNVKSGKGLNVASASEADGGNVVQWPYGGGANEQWYMVETAAGSGKYNFVNLKSGKYMDVKGGSTADGAVVNQWTGNGGTNQQWQITDLGSGNSKITCVKSGKALDVSGASTADGAQIIQSTYTGADNQQWKLVKLN